MTITLPTFDSTEFQILDFTSPSGTKRSLTPQGFLLIEDCKIAKAGVFTYLASNFQPHAFTDRQPTDPIRVFRSKETIEKAAAGFSGAPVTDDHPAEMLNVNNTRKFQKGHINGEVRVENGVMFADLMITDKTAISNIEKGKDQLSNGYFSQYIFNSGLTPEGEAFDCEQIEIRPNHVAIVIAGRNGPECRVSDSIDPHKEEKRMAIVTINGVSYEASEQVAQAVGILQVDLDAKAKVITNAGNVDERIQTAVEAKVKEMQTTIDTKDAEIDKLKTEIPSSDKLEELAAQRAELVTKAKTLSPKLDCKGKSLVEIKSAVVLDKCDDLKTLDGKSEDYIEARFDGLKVDKKPSKGNQALGDAFTTQDLGDEPGEMVKKARDQAIEKKKKMAMRNSGHKMAS